MSEEYYNEFEKLKEKLKELPMLTLELTMSERFFEKYEVIKIGEQLFLVCNRPIKVEGGFKYELLPVNNETLYILENPVSLVDTFLPEL